MEQLTRITHALALREDVWRRADGGTTRNPNACRGVLLRWAMPFASLMAT